MTTRSIDSAVVPPAKVLEVLGKHLLVDGFHLVVDLEKSRGSRLHDSSSGKTYLDFYTFFGSCPVGINHPRLMTREFEEKLLRAGRNKPANSDVYTTEMAEFVETLDRLAMPKHLPHLFLIEGGALGVENALKAAFDWKVRKNLEKGYTRERGTQVIHFRNAFHGRTGYTLSLTNTDPVKTDYFPKFRWPRIDNPRITFPLTQENLATVERAEALAVRQIERALAENPDDIAAIIIEPIQAEGGDHHFRPEFFKELRRLADQNEVMLIVDEVQTGVGLTGKMWAYEHFGIEPDMLCFGKKLQVCGVMASRRIDEVPGNVFAQSGRINSTWGGNLADMVRATTYLEIIREENLVENAARMGAVLLQGLARLESRYAGLIGNVRGRGLMCAFDLPTAAQRNRLKALGYEEGVILLGCGVSTVRFRPALSITQEEVDEGIEKIDRCLARLG
jgi:L-lysine 6-transaminase